MAETGSFPAQTQTPSLKRRMACWLYEGVLLFGVLWITSYLLGTLTQSRHALQHRTELQWALFAVLGLYFIWFWRKGQTLAMKTWHVRVLNRHHQAPSGPQALLRYLLSWLWFAPPLLLTQLAALPIAESLVLLLGWPVIYALLSRFLPEKQFLHDCLAGTRLYIDPPAAAV